MDPRTHVALALARTLQRPGNWPTANLDQLRNQVLDEAGGDLRTLVVFLVQLAAFGVPQAIEEAGASVSWDALRKRLALDLCNERFIVPEVARWGVDAWGVALEVPGAHLPAIPPPDALPPPSLRAWPADAAGGQRTRGGRRPHPRAVVSAPSVARNRAVPGPSAHIVSGAPAVGVPGWVKPGKVPSVPRWIPGSNVMHATVPAPSVSSLSRAECRGLLSLGALAIAALVVMWRLPGSSSEPVGREGTVPRAEGEPVETTEALPGSSSTGVIAPGSGAPDSRAAQAPDGRPPLAASSLLDGRFQLRASRSSVEGDSRCASIADRVQWDHVSVEQFRVSSDGRRFDVPTRPGLTGSLDPSGAFQSRVLHGERDGTTSSFQMYGWANATGFRAIGETRTRTLLRWRHVLDCLFIAEFVGVRLAAAPASPAPLPP